MISLDEDALICDLAETYHIYDYKSLPLKLVATLSAGLRENSRIGMLSQNISVTQDTLLLAMIIDRIEAFRYGFMAESNPPQSIAEILLNQEKKTAGFSSVEEFEAELARIRGD